MGKKYFGTDGVRGRVGESPITPDLVMRLGYAAGKVLVARSDNPHENERPVVMIGKDTRISGYMLESALEAGLCAAGVDVLLVGPMPTPGVGSGPQSSVSTPAAERPASSAASTM